MKVGSLVECVLDSWVNIIPEIETTAYPKKGNEYIISGFAGMISRQLRLYEFVTLEGFGDEKWDACAFRELQPPMEINIEEIIKETQTA